MTLDHTMELETWGCRIGAVELHQPSTINKLSQTAPIRLDMSSIFSQSNAHDSDDFVPKSGPKSMIHCLNAFSYA